MPSPHTRARSLMALWALLVSTSFPVGSAITGALDPVVLTFCRFCLAATVFFVLAAATGSVRRPSLRDLARYGTVSASMVAYFVLMFEALRWTSPVNTGALFTLVPLMSAGVGWVMVKQRTTVWTLACLCLAGVGAMWVVFDGSLSQLASMSLDRGELTFLVGAAAFSAYSPLISKLHRGERAVEMALWTLVMGAVELGVLGAGRIASTEWSAVPGYAWIGIIWLATGPTAVTFGIAQFSSVRLTAATVMSYTYLVPSLVVILVGLTGGGWPAPAVWGGVALTLSAMLLLQWRQLRLIGAQLPLHTAEPT